MKLEGREMTNSLVYLHGWRERLIRHNRSYSPKLAGDFQHPKAEQAMISKSNAQPDD